LVGTARGFRCLLSADPRFFKQLSQPSDREIPEIAVQ
jgi:hypothetical protein